jgi:hypothetical protein
MSLKRIPVEVYSRVVGYFRPANQYNKGKKEEFYNRKNYAPDEIEKSLNEFDDKRHGKRHGKRT